eukprot:CAMPEP_0114118768 /NCGR_PEP_ID=MMETSP0043_2-20121206/5757_1 /TAXON_ID=464988 /ORGANISM="Hemiselmis andersenii, Strain CCMP644" /LENGTH=66 /DNA_ID=CAMNT_0001211277 /DNA_START=130 /DNA_END=327 /DNA_ORIENTATION=+
MGTRSPLTQGSTASGGRPTACGMLRGTLTPMPIRPRSSSPTPPASSAATTGAASTRAKARRRLIIP